MGTDLFTSSRGPGLIGTLMALVVLLGFGALYFFVFDERFQGGGQTLESIIEDDARQITSLGQRLSSNRLKLEATKDFKKIASDLRAATTQRDIALSRREKLQQEVASLKDEIAEFEESVAKYKQAYRESARATMVGREMDELKTTDDKTYTKVRITDIDPVRMQIRHQGGITGVALDTLPEDLQDYLQLDDSERAQQLAAEATAREQQSRHADQGEALHRIQTLRHRLSELEKKRNDARRLSARAQDAIPEIQQAIEMKHNELLIEQQKAATGGISNAPQVRAQISQLESKLRRARQQGPALSAEASALDREIAGMEAEIRTIEEEVKRKKAKQNETG